MSGVSGTSTPASVRVGRGSMLLGVGMAIFLACTINGKSGHFYKMESLADSKPLSPTPWGLWKRTEDASIVEVRRSLYAGISPAV